MANLTKVLRDRKFEYNLTAMQYGNGFRIKYEKVTRSKVDSKLVAHHDEEYTEIEKALNAFNQMWDIISYTVTGDSKHITMDQLKAAFAKP